MRTRHRDLAAAKRELIDHGYFPLCQNPDTGIEPWARPKKNRGNTRYAIARVVKPRSVNYVITKI